MSKTNQNTGPGGIRYLCWECASSDGREIVHSFPSKRGGPCHNCGVFIEIGDDTYVLDSGYRGSRYDRPDPTPSQDSTPTSPVPTQGWSPWDH